MDDRIPVDFISRTFFFRVAPLCAPFDSDEAFTCASLMRCGYSESVAGKTTVSHFAAEAEALGCELVCPRVIGGENG